ncbi:MAG TPA: YgjP-like metallopeptidase domain-containing protein [Dermatophilaceae bacterium]|nr:YgjP-like metallopeptidase domain-containing protein [Dermatophilaceae bacterium]
MTQPRPAPEPAGERVEVRRSVRRRKTVSAYRQDGRTVVLIPAGFSRRQEREWVQAMLRRLAESELRRRPSDAQLASRAGQLSRTYLAGRAVPTRVAWVGNQRTRWGSCTSSDGSIRVSTRLQQMPGWVLDYVLLHELAHLLEPDHGARFWGLLAGFPRTERARGYLQGVAAASSGRGDGGDGDAASADVTEDGDASGADVTEDGDAAGAELAGDRPTLW